MLLRWTGLAISVAALTVLSGGECDGGFGFASCVADDPGSGGSLLPFGVVEELYRAERFAGRLVFEKSESHGHAAGNDEISTHLQSVFDVDLELHRHPDTPVPSPDLPAQAYQAVFDPGTAVVVNYTVSGERTWHYQHDNQTFINPAVIPPDASKPAVHAARLTLEPNKRSGTLSVSLAGYAAFFWEDNPIPYVHFVDSFSAEFHLQIRDDRTLEVSRLGAKTGPGVTAYANGKLEPVR